MANTGRGGSMSLREAGHRGGERTSQTHGRDFYSDIGRKGGEHSHRSSSSGRQSGRR